MFKRFKKPQKLNSDQRISKNQPSPVAFSYYAKGLSNKSSNTGRLENSGRSLNKVKSQVRVRHIPSYIALTAIVVAVVYSSILQTEPRVTVLNTPGSISRDQASYQNIIQSEWKDSVLNRSKLTVSTGEIRKNLKSQLNEVKRIDIELPLIGHRPKVVLYPASPVLRYVSINGSYYVDDVGVVLAKTTLVKENNVPVLPEIIDETDIKSEVGKQVLTTADVNFLDQLYKQLLAQSIKVKSITLPRNAANEADVRIEGEGYYIKFSTETNPRQVVGSYLAVKAKLDSDGKKPQSYIDARVDEKVFVK